MKANGGGTVDRRSEGRRDINPAGGTATPTSHCRPRRTAPTITCVAGYLGGTPFFGGVDLNGDGDTLDTVTVLAPSQTQTHRYGVIAGLRYDINDDHTRPRRLHASTTPTIARPAKSACSTSNGEPFDVFPVNDPLADATGVNLQKRDRQSYAILHQVCGRISRRVLRRHADRQRRRCALPFFKRDLNNYCFTSVGQRLRRVLRRRRRRSTRSSREQPYVVNPTRARSPVRAAEQRVFKYDEAPAECRLRSTTSRRGSSVFANYAKGLSVPSTDNLYNAFFFARGTAAGQAQPGNDRQLRPRPSLPQLEDPGPARGLVHHVQRPHRLGLRSRAQPDACSATSARSINTASTARSPTQPIKQLNALRVRLVEQVGDQGRHPDRRMPAAQSTCDTSIRTAPSTGAAHLRLHRRQARIRRAEVHVRRVAASARSARSSSASPPSGPARATSSTPTSRCSRRHRHRRRRLRTADLSPADGSGLLAGQSRCPPQPGLLDRARRRPTSSSTSTTCSTSSMSAGSAAASTRRSTHRGTTSGATIIPTYGSPPFVQIGAPRTVSADAHRRLLIADHRILMTRRRRFTPEAAPFSFAAHCPR